MPGTIGVLAVHGMGTFSPKKPESVTKPDYSAKLFANVRDRFGAKDFDKSVVWREAFYSHPFDKNQERFVEKTRNLVSYDFFRKLTVSNLGDPGSYHGGYASSGNVVYDAVNASVVKSLDGLRAKLSAGSPIVVIAHSLGGHVVSNAIWDLQKKPATAPGDIAAIVTIGCNLSLFLFGEDPKKIRAVKYPGSALPAGKRPKAWWRNYFDRNDPLGFPIGPTGGDYEKMAKDAALLDEQVDVGWPILSMTAFSHVAYWGDRDIAVRVNNLLQVLR